MPGLQRRGLLGLVVWPRQQRFPIGGGQRQTAATAFRMAGSPRPRARLVPTGSGQGRLPEDRASRSATPAGRLGGRPASCPTTCGRQVPAARHNPGGHSGAPCRCRHREPGRGEGSWAGCRSAASSHTSASRARTAAVSKPLHMLTLRVSAGLVAVAELLGQVLGQVADAPGGVFGPGEHALGVELGPEAGHMQGLVIIGDGVQGLIPGGQQLAGGGVEVAAAGLIPTGR
jgi:hypothetical protein